MIINSKGIKVLFFSDSHNQSDRLRKIIKGEAADINLFLGDYFHSFFHNGEEEIRKTCEFYNEFVGKDNFINCWGNHCCVELFPSEYTLCSGYSPRLAKITNKYLDRKLIDNTKWHVFIDDFLCSHAGLHSYYLPPNAELNIDWLDNWLTKEGERATLALKTKDSHWMFRAGRGRGGSQRYGGLTWLDWETEFEDIEGVSQICGHSTNNKIRKNGESYCIDTELNQWVTITNGKLEIRSYKDL